jgi:hypothetical protein
MRIQNQLRQIPSRLLREGRYAPLPLDAQYAMEPDNQCGQIVDACAGGAQEGPQGGFTNCTGGKRTTPRL